MPALATRLDPRGPEFAASAAAMRALVDNLRGRLDAVRAGGPPAARARHEGRGKLLVRDCIDLLLDPGPPFLERGALAARGLYGGEVPSAGLVAGIGRVAGREVMAVANDATVKGGAYDPLTVRKHLRAQDIAAENRLPGLCLVDPGGAYLPLQDEVLPDERGFGRIFLDQARMSAAGIPQIALVPGSCTAGGDYVPAMSVEVVIVPGPGHHLPGRPAAGAGGDGRGGPGAGSSRRSTARRGSAASPTSGGTPSGSSPTTASSSARARSRARISWSSAASGRSRSCSCRPSAASWWAGARGRAASPRTGPRWSPPSPPRGSPRTR